MLERVGSSVDECLHSRSHRTGGSLTDVNKPGNRGQVSLVDVNEHEPTVTQCNQLGMRGGT